MDATEEELVRLERSLLEPEVRKSPERLDELLDDDFLEFGSSGRVFDKRGIMEELAGEPSRAVSATDFAVRRLGPDLALVTYRSHRVVEKTSFLRSSIWRRSEGRWRIVFHQGTPTGTKENL